jgi:crotonobetainyl-CoA:carnitine CoA-transferase CaiB-like acyl-CoA transferase
LTQLQVLDLCRDLAGSYCGRLFAGMGASVVKVEPPGGDPMRSASPFRHGKPSLEAGGLFLHLNAGKRGVTLDLESDSGRDLLLGLVAKSDVVIESFPPGRMHSLGLGYDHLKAANPGVVLVSISPFGQTGPYRDYRATEIGLRAISGEMYLAGQPSQPLKKGGNVGQYLGGLNGFIGAMGAVFQREATGEGRHVDVSITESLASIVGQALREQAAWNFIPGRRQGGLGWPNNIYPCKDGYMMTFTAYGVGDAWWRPFAELISGDDPRDVPASPPRDEMAQKEWDDLFKAWLAKHTRREAHREAQKKGLAFGYLATAEDIMGSAQLGHRGFLKQQDHPVAGRHTLMHLPFLVDGERFPVDRAPLLGEHNDYVFGDSLSPAEGRSGHVPAARPV